ncbi:hypothetical protein INT43_008272 [Umbelopsis isabellina]|uniref:Uncharacterized protein n=1 Tax=Mortierella isabellina TaxID=91625 RepID=A0A8H7U6P9_MORIS|nr:hypothetical protein INT43_008272 [Umbelopsis isabellina]
MTAVMQNNPGIAVADDEDDVALAAFLAPNWGRFDQDKLAFDIMSYRHTTPDPYADYNMRQRKISNGEVQVQKSTSTPVLRSRDRQSTPPLYQQPKHSIPARREESPANRQCSQPRRDESPKSRSPSAKSRRESPQSRSSDSSRDISPGSNRRPSPHNNARPAQAYQSPSDHKHHHSLPKRTPTPIPLLTQSSAQFTVQDRRPSLNSVKSATPSIRSEMSMNTKLSLSKRLRRVFSMSSLSLKNNGSSTSLVSTADSDIVPKASRSSSAQSIASQQLPATDSESPVNPTTSVSTPPKSSSRRRSLVTLSNIFSRSSEKQKAEQVEPTVQAVIVPAQTGANQRHSAADLRKMINEQPGPPVSNRATAKPDRLKLDTSLESIQQSAKTSLKQTRRTSSSRPPDSPSSISSASRSPVTPPPHRQGPKGHSSYASAVASSNARPRQSSINSNSSARADYFTSADLEHSDILVPPPSTGLNSLPLHGSPRMKPAPQSNTMLAEPTSMREIPPPATARTRRLGFSTSITVHETFSANEYDRRCDPNVTCCKLTPEFAMRIKQELNEYKLTGMEVHIESRQYTHFFL